MASGAFGRRPGGGRAHVGSPGDGTRPGGGPTRAPHRRAAPDQWRGRNCSSDSGWPRPAGAPVHAPQAGGPQARGAGVQGQRRSMGWRGRKRANGGVGGASLGARGSGGTERGAAAHKVGEGGNFSRVWRGRLRCKGGHRVGRRRGWRGREGGIRFWAAELARGRKF